MCGLYGYFTPGDIILTRSQRNQRFQAAKELAILNEARGTHSSGFAYQERGKDHMETVKTLGSSTQLLKDRQARDNMKQANTSLLIGHTRYATTGAISIPNAHPYAYGSIVGAHNGWMTNHYTLAHKYGLKYQVDSQLIFQLLDKWKNNYTSIINQISGPAALVYTEMKSKNLYLLRHDNPLSVAWIPELHTYMWSSQENHLDEVVAKYANTQELRLDNNQILRINQSGKTRFKDIKIKEDVLAKYADGILYNFGYNNYYEETADGVCDWCRVGPRKLRATGYGQMCLKCIREEL